MKSAQDRDNRRRKLLRYALSSGIALLITYCVAAGKAFAPEASAQDILHGLSDGFFISGVLLASVGGMLWVSTTGFFDLFGYCGHWFLTLLSASKTPLHYYDYKCEKEAKRGKARFELLIVGAGCLVLAGLTLWLYYTVG